MPSKKTVKAGTAKAGRVSMKDMISIINKKAGRNVAHDLNGENQTPRNRASLLYILIPSLPSTQAF